MSRRRSVFQSLFIRIALVNAVLIGLVFMLKLILPFTGLITAPVYQVGNQIKTEPAMGSYWVTAIFYFLFGASSISEIIKQFSQFNVTRKTMMSMIQLAFLGNVVLTVLCAALYNHLVNILYHATPEALYSMPFGQNFLSFAVMLMIIVVFVELLLNVGFLLGFVNHLVKTSLFLLILFFGSWALSAMLGLIFGALPALFPHLGSIFSRFFGRLFGSQNGVNQPLAFGYWEIGYSALTAAILLIVFIGCNWRVMRSIKVSR